MAKSRKKRKGRPRTSYNTSGLARYRAISSAIRESYKERGVEYDRRIIREEYHSKKESLKSVPLSQINNAISGIYAPIGKEKVKGQADIKKGDVPETLRAFDWYYFEKAFSRHSDFFKPDDTIVLNLDIIGLDPIEFQYADLGGRYNQNRKNIMPLVKNFSPPPQFHFTGVNKGVYSWNLEGELKEGAEAPVQKEPLPEKELPRKGVPITPEKEAQTERIEAAKQRTIEKKIELAKAREKASLAKAKLKESEEKATRARIKEIAQLRDLYKEGLITKAQFQKRFNKLS